MEKFIIAFSVEEKEELEKAGFTLLQSIDNRMFIFENSDVFTYAKEKGKEFMLTNQMFF